MKYLGTAIRIVFLVLFGLLIFNGKNVIWLGIFIVSLISALFFGRFYCGYICPMNTIMKPIEWLSKKLGLQTDKAPKWLSSGVLSWIVLFIAVAGMIGAKKVLHVEVPILIILLVISAIVALRYKPAVFHNGICPFGALLSLTGKLSILSKKVDIEKCIGCKKCESVCPSEAIIVTDKKAKINTELCFQCTNCQDVCPTDAIAYKKAK